MRKRMRVAALVVVAAVVGYAGAAVYTALAAPSVQHATSFGPDDGLTRYVLTAVNGNATPELLSRLEKVPGVTSAQRLTGGRALVATRGLTPDALSGVAGVAAVEPSVSVPLSTVTDPYWASYGWNLENNGANAYNQKAVSGVDTKAPTAWPNGTGGGIVVAVVDSGYYAAHADLAGALWTNSNEPCGSVDTDGNGLPGDCHGWNFYANSADVDNGSSGTHGTAVSGTVGARAGNGAGTAGMAPGVTIMPLAVGGGSTVDVYLCAEAIRYAVDHGASIINASWGGAMGGSALQALKDAVAYAAAHDVLIVAAAGNDSGNRDTSLSYPASLPDWNVVTVGASTAADTVSGFSAYGATSVDLFAPGSGIFVPWNDGGYRVVDGTSFSAPEVAGVLALYKEAMPAVTAAQLKQALLNDVTPVAAFAGKSVTGGRLDASHIGNGLGGVQYSYTSMSAPAGTVTPQVTVTAPAAVATYSVAVGLGMEYQGEIWALSGKPITLNGATVSTDDTGSALFTLGSMPAVSGLALTPSADLAAARYVLTVQLYKDGAPSGRMSAAPLLVGSATTTPPAGGSTSPGGGSTTPSTPGGGATSPGTPGGGSTSPTSPGPGSGGSGSSPAAPGVGSGPIDSSPGTSPGPGAGGSPSPGGGSTSPGGGTTSPGGGTPPGGGTTSPGSTTPPGGGTTSPGTPGGSTTSPSTPGGGSTSPSTPGGTTPPGGGGTVTYPGVGPFRITSMTPAQVSTAGGTLVTIQGGALPSSPTVRVGPSAPATVISSSSTQLIFRAPALVAGSYDVTVFAPGGTTSWVLSGALAYVSPSSGSTTPSTPGGGSTTPSTPGGGSTTPSTPGGGSTAPSTPGGGSTTPSTPGGGSTTPSTPGGGSVAAPVVRTGPAGERLVRSAMFSRLGSIWSMNCSTSCAGVAV